MAKVISKSLFFIVVVFLILPGMGYAQSNPHTLYKDIISSDYHFSYISSAAPPKVLEYPIYGDFSLQNAPEEGDLYNYTYAPGVAEANTRVVIEYYREDASTGNIVPEFTTINFRITESIISCADDRKSIEKNSGSISVDVLENDSRTNGPLTLESVLYSENGVASVSGDMISFVPDADFVGDAFVYYSVKDAIGKMGSGLLKIKVVDPSILPNKLNLDYISHGGEPVEIDLPYDGFKLKASLQHGSFKNINGSQLYIPTANRNSEETFQISNGNLTRFVTVKVIYKPNPNSWVRDDVRYTAKGKSVTLDVTRNDLKRNQEIVQHSSELKPDANLNGVYTYTPPSYYSGSKKMNYTVNDGYHSETGTVTVHVNNFYPQTKHDYEFITIGNAPLVINYNIPIIDYSFSVVSGPSRGKVSINEGSSTINFTCDNISGNNLIIYEPNYNYTGDDDFKLRYCVDGNCKNIEIKVKVLAEDGENCRCYTGCVWAGDANNDGVVNAADLISAAYAFGQSGAESAGSSTSWYGRKAQNWLFETSNGVNAKFSDADGNGIIEEIDFDAIEENYNLNHALVPPQFIEKKAFPFTLELEKDTVYAGDLINFDIGIGNDFFPALDVHGLTYSLGFPPSFVDSASLQVDYFSDSWFGIDEKVVGITKQIRTGWLESAVSRLSVTPHSGAGAIGKVSFIVEEDVVGGFRVKNSGIIPLTIRVTDIQVMTSAGELASLEDAETTVYIDINGPASDKESDLKLYPNPASDFLNLHMNGGHHIMSYQIYNTNGQILFSSGQLHERAQKISLAGFDQGIYILKAQTTTGPRVDKFEVIR